MRAFVQNVNKRSSLNFCRLHIPILPMAIGNKELKQMTKEEFADFKKRLKINMGDTKNDLRSDKAMLNTLLENYIYLYEPYPFHLEEFWANYKKCKQKIQKIIDYLMRENDGSLDDRSLWGYKDRINLGHW